MEVEVNHIIWFTGEQLPPNLVPDIPVKREQEDNRDDDNDNDHEPTLIEIKSADVEGLDD